MQIGWFTSSVYNGKHLKNAGFFTGKIPDFQIKFIQSHVKKICSCDNIANIL